MSKPRGVHEALLGDHTASGLPIREIPGSYGVPFFSAIRDRIDYFYLQGEEEYYKSRIAGAGGSTVVRLNMPPGPFMSRDSRVVALLDSRSFRVMMDSSKVDRSAGVFGTYMPPFSLFGGYRPLTFTDTTAEKHEKLKGFLVPFFRTRVHHVLSPLRATFLPAFDALASAVAANGKAEFNDPLRATLLDFFSLTLFGGAPPSQVIGPTAGKKATSWLGVLSHPLVSKVLPLPWPIEDLLLHTFQIPPVFVKRDYDALKKFFSGVAAGLLDEIEREVGISREEMINQILFIIFVNAWGGMAIAILSFFSFVGAAGAAVQARLAAEVRSATAGEKTVTLAALERMPLVKSVVWETLRIHPVVKHEYGWARDDMVVESHDAAYRVKKGELLLGYQPLAMKDERVFHNGHQFVADRFVPSGHGGAPNPPHIMEYLIWSNGPETAQPLPGNKQCAGKDLALTIFRSLVAEFFLHYDSFTVDVTAPASIDPKVTFRSLTRRAD